MILTEPMQLAKLQKQNKKQDEFQIDNGHWTHRGNIIFIEYKKLPILEKESQILKFHFDGNSKIAKNAPWDGGWIFTQDEKGSPKRKSKRLDVVDIRKSRE